MKAKPRVPDPRGEKPERLAANEAGCGRISLRCASMRRNIALNSPGIRGMSVKRFHRAGIFTWVSLEPTLDVVASVQIVEQTHRFVDLFKVGRVNYLPMTKTTDWKDY